MGITAHIIEYIFGAALFINAALFIPQALRILKKKSARDTSLVTFLGFFLIQLAITLHAYVKHDYLLLAGYVVSMIACGFVVVVILVYRNAGGSIDTACSLSMKEIFEQLPGNIYWKDERGYLIGGNTNNRSDFGGCSEDEFRKKTDYDFLSKKEADQIRLADERVMRDGQAVVAEELLTTRSGERVLYLSHKNPLKDKNGRTIGVVGYSIDVTDMKREAEKQLSILESVISVMPGNVYWMNKDGVYMGCNDNEARAVGLSSRKDIVGKKNEDIPGFVIPEEIDPVNREVIKFGKTITAEEPVTLPDGSPGVFLSNKAPVRDNEDKIVGMVGISIDITDRKKQEKELVEAKLKAEESNRIKSDFISNMEHDIRTPFVGIYGMVNILMEQEADPEKKDLLKDVSFCAKELMDYCDKILDFSKVDAGESPVLSRRFSLSEVVNSVTTMESIAAKSKGLEFSSELGATVPDMLVGDPQRLKRILLNLISNAIKFTNDGSVRLSVDLCSTNPNKRQVVVHFSVKDTGMGIAEEQKTLIYEKFTKVVPSNKGLYKGLGLGLRIVKQFVNEMDGEIDLQSEINGGTTFSLYIPFKIPLSDGSD
jgi:PAS domain S-box-containing protein